MAALRQWRQSPGRCLVWFCAVRFWLTQPSSMLAELPLQDQQR